jgi:hypothetical protein
MKDSINEKANLFINIVKKSNGMLHACVILMDDDFSLLDTYSNHNIKEEVLKNTLKSMILTYLPENLAINIISSTPNIYEIVPEIIPTEIVKINNICNKEDLLHYYSLSEDYTLAKDEKENFEKLVNLCEMTIEFYKS